MSRKVFWSGKLEPEQLNRLGALRERTRVPVAEFVRQGVNLVLEREELKLAALDANEARRRARKGRAA